MDTIQTESIKFTIDVGKAYSEYFFNDSLEHHGVKGMKWGVRKDRKRERQIRKAEKYEKKASDIQALIDKKSKPNSRSVARLTEKRDSYIRDAKLKRSGKMSIRERKALIGGAVVASLVATKLTADFLNSGEARRYLELGKAAINKQSFEFKKDSALADKNLSVEDISNKIVNKINPGYGQPGTKMNCRRATYAYEMNRRGYDVSATRTTNGYGQTKIGTKYALSPESKERHTGITASAIKATQGMLGKDKKMQQIISWSRTGQHNIDLKPAKSSGAHSIFNTLSKQPNGSRGEFAMTWRSGGGHSMAYEIIKGKPVIFDNQTRQVYKNPVDIARLSANMSSAGFTRLDDLPLNEDFLMKWVKNSKR